MLGPRKQGRGQGEMNLERVVEAGHAGLCIHFKDLRFHSKNGRKSLMGFMQERFEELPWFAKIVLVPLEWNRT